MRTVITDQYPIYIGKDSLESVGRFLSEKKYSSVFVITDENTKKRCLPLLKKAFTAPISQSFIQIKSGEKNKNIRSCEKIWKELSKQNADRKALLINLGGGMISDIGAFVASTYKRGIDFVNIPTTLLAQVDASVGGKTGIDFLNYKNQIGTFAFPKAVFIQPDFLRTLNKRELVSGFAEVLKHGLIADKNYWNSVKNANPLNVNVWEEVIMRSIEIKNNIVSQDPRENGIRKALNFGHTVGHAIESAYLKSKKPLLHGEAIATGIICEAYLSRKITGLKNEELDEITSTISSVFKPKAIRFPAKQLIGLMKQDKKNKGAEINFTLLRAIGSTSINNSCTDELIEEALNFLNTSCA